MSKASDAFRTISEVSDELDIPKHVLRFWEVKFPQIRPMKRGGGRRYYRPEDLELLRGIRYLLHAEKYTIKGVQKILREQGIDQVKAPLQSAKAAASATRGKRAKRATGATAATPLVDISVRPVERTLSTVSAVNSSEKLALIKEAIAELEACRAMLKGDAIPKAGRRTGRRTAPNAARA